MTTSGLPACTQSPTFSRRRHMPEAYWKDNFRVHVSLGSAETLVGRGGIINHHSIAYSLSNISAKNYRNRLMWVESIVCKISVVFLRHSVYFDLCRARKNTPTVWVFSEINTNLWNIVNMLIGWLTNHLMTYEDYVNIWNVAVCEIRLCFVGFHMLTMAIISSLIKFRIINDSATS